MTEADWTSTDSISDLARWLTAPRSIVTLTHVKPDGDAVGSSIALVRALNIAAGGSGSGFSGVASRAEAWFAGPTPMWLGAITGQTKTRLIAGPESIPGSADPDAVVIVDTGSWSQLEPFKAWIADRPERCAIIDHHLRGDADVAPRRHIDTSAAAACQIVAALCVKLLRVESIAKLPLEVAEPLYLGIATDTGWFRHSNVTPAVLRVAADLLEAGVNHEALLERIEFTERPSRMKLLARALNSITYHCGGRVAIMHLDKRDFDATNAAPGESGGFLDLVRSVEAVRVAALLTEVTEGVHPVTKISLRSKGGPGMVDVNKVASVLGGGGHAQAAGARVAANLSETKARLLDAIPLSEDGDDA